MYPEHDFIAVPQELHKDEGLLQLHALLREAGQQQLPQAVQLVQAAADGLRGKVVGCYHLTARVVEDHNSVRMRCHLRLECLVFLDLGLQSIQ